MRSVHLLDELCLQPVANNASSKITSKSSPNPATQVPQKPDTARTQHSFCVATKPSFVFADLPLATACCLFFHQNAANKNIVLWFGSVSDFKSADSKELESQRALRVVLSNRKKRSLVFPQSQEPSSDFAGKKHEGGMAG